MSDPGPLFFEAGAPWWPVALGPVLALAGALAETAAPGGADWLLWAIVAVVLTLPLLLVVRARRRFLAVELTATTLRHGTQELPTSHVAAARAPHDAAEVLATPKLGDHAAVPRRHGSVVLVLTDGARRIAWARDADRLRAALTSLIAARTAS